MLTAEKLRDVLEYNSKTGKFKWRVKRQGVKLDKSAGVVNGAGYEQIQIDGKRYLSHRLAWLYSYGEWPKGILDHVNRDRSDNRIENIREATRSENSVNAKVRSNNRIGLKGVSFNKQRNKFMAKIKHNGKIHFLGLFNSAKQAHQAYCIAARKFYGEFVNIR